MTPLSSELSARIEQEAEDYAEKTGDRLSNIKEYYTHNDRQAGYEEGAKAYAHYKERCDALERWKRETKILLDPLLEYGQSKEAAIPLGKSITEVILQRAKQFQQAKKALEEIVEVHQKYRKINDENRESNHLRNIAYEVLLSTWKEEGKGEDGV